MSLKTLTPEAFVSMLGDDLPEVEQMRQATYRGVAHAPLPANYVAARSALAECLKADGWAFLAKYDAAKAALAECAKVDECAAWNKAAGMASYARQAHHDTLERLAGRVEARLTVVLVALLARG